MTPETLISLPEALERLGKEAEVAIVYDWNAQWVLREVLQALGESPVRCCIGLKAGEEEKTLATAENLCRELLQADVSRSALLLAIGGGITTDIAGFAAGIYKRGIRHALLPTTLLGMVDAAVGGKTGVNFCGYKNMLGSFKMPEFTAIEGRFLSTLPPRELRCGLSEMLKTFLVADGAAYRAFLGEKPAPEQLQPWILRAASCKQELVRKDPLDHGERTKLNLGHSFAHAIEHAALASAAPIPHGEAVSMGMLLAARLSEGIGLAQKGIAEQLKADFTRLGLPAECPFPKEALRPGLAKDKKAGAGKLTFVLPVRPGQVELRPLSVEEALEKL